MNLTLPSVLGTLLLAGVPAPARAQSPAVSQPVDSSAPRVSFHVDRPGLPVPHYTLTVLESGAIVYEGEEVMPAAPGAPSDAAGPAAGRPFRIDAHISSATAKRIFASAKSLKDFNVQCDAHAKNIADTGKKTFSYTAPGAHGECTYNYSENKTVTQLTDTFLAITETMDEGRHLDHLHRFDRLGLDAAISTFADQVNSGRAQELATIAGTLRSIAADTSLIQRVRIRAGQLLSLLPPELQQNP